MVLVQGIAIGVGCMFSHVFIIFIDVPVSHQWLDTPT